MMTERTRIELDRLPPSGPLYRRALLGALPMVRGRRADRLPAVELAVSGVTVDRAHLAEYDRVCGFRLTDHLPATYPHVLGFPLALRLMTAPDFPLPLVGLVHVANRITLRRPIDAGEPLDLRAHATDLRPHRRGRQLDLVLVASVAGVEVWRGTSTYLHREPTPDHRDHQDRRPETGQPPHPDHPGHPDRTGHPDHPNRTDHPDRTGDDSRDRPAPPTPSALWWVNPGVGTAYARVSGDHNPIHTSRVGARLFGFPRPIAHGMWSKARCLAALAGRLPQEYTVDVTFKRPVPLPGTVGFSTTQDGAPAPADTYGRTDTSAPGSTFRLDADAPRPVGFALHDPRTGRPHLAGTLD